MRHGSPTAPASGRAVMRPEDSVSMPTVAIVSAGLVGHGVVALAPPR